MGEELQPLENTELPRFFGALEPRKPTGAKEAR